MKWYTTEARSSSYGGRSHWRPVLEEGQLSFPDGIYRFGYEEISNGFILEHQIEGAHLITRFLSEGKARYVCVVSAPASCYRRVYLSDKPRQRIEWDSDAFFGSILLSPRIISMGSDEIVLDRERDGVHSIWDGVKRNFLKGNLLAVGNILDFTPSAFSMLDFKEDETLSEGSFYVEEGGEGQNFGFRIRFSPELRGMENHWDAKRNFLAHVFTACLALLQRQFGGENPERDWRDHRTLIRLAEEMEKRGIALWDNEDGFLPEKAATLWMSLVLPRDLSDGENN